MMEMDPHSPPPIDDQQQVYVDIHEGVTNEGLDPFSSKLCDHHIISMSVVDDDDDPLVLNYSTTYNSHVMDGGGKEKRKKGCSVSAKKPPRPPHRGFSLDAADQKLIRELAELAMIKRARIERMKALMQKKASKATTASSSSSNATLFGMLFTIIFFLIILFQGMSCQNSHGTFQGSPQTNENSIIYIEVQLNHSTHNSV